jgi:hypothetical protein
MGLYNHILEVISQEWLIRITKYSALLSSHICHPILLLMQGVFFPPFISCRISLVFFEVMEFHRCSP